MARNRNNRNRLLVPQSAAVLNQFKEEIAAEFGVQTGASSTARANGSVGGEITKRLVSQAERQQSDPQQ